MIYLPSQPRFWYDDEDTGGEATSEPEPQEVDVETLSVEERDRLLDNWDEETLEVETETERPEESETPEVEVEDEPEVEETAEEPVEETETSEEPERLLAGKYKTAEELEKAYRETSAESTRMAQRLKELEEQRQTSETPQEPPEPEKPQEEKPSTEKRNPYKLTEEQKQEIDDLRYTEGDTEANARMAEIIEQNRAEIAAEQRAAQEVAAREAQTKAAIEHNQKLAHDFFKEQAYEALKGTEIDSKILDVLADPNSRIDVDLALKAFGSQEALDEFAENLDKVRQKVERFRPGKDGKYSMDDYKEAQLLVNPQQRENEIRRKAALETVQQVTKGAPTAKIITPSKTSHAGVKPKFSATDSREQVREKSAQLSDAEQKAAMEAAFDD